MTIAPQIDAGLHAQLELARQVQLRLLPDRRCCISDWEVAFSYESAGFVSGDYVDQVFTMLDRRISLFLCLPLATLDTFSLQKEIDNIGKR